MKRAVFLDRDGVINRVFIRDGLPHSPLTVDEFDLMPGVPQALDRLRRAGFLLIIVTNQPEVARGRTSRQVVEAIHSRLRTMLPLDDIQVCYHDDIDRCACRKPAPGMLYAAAVDWDVQLEESYLVGDRWRDIAAGRHAGCTTILVDSGHDEKSSVEPTARKRDLAEATDWILSRVEVGA